MFERSIYLEKFYYRQDAHHRCNVAPENTYLEDEFCRQTNKTICLKAANVK